VLGIDPDGCVLNYFWCAMATVLAIETSCDETAVAVVRDRTLLSNVVAS
jgi:hypothetical protein